MPKKLSEELIERHGSEAYIEMIKSDVETVFGTQAGIRLLDFLEWFCYADRGLDADGASDRQFFINEGKRQIYITLQTMLTRDVDDVLEAFKR
jgi:hypothetical protein